MMQRLVSVPLQNNNKPALMLRHVNFILNQPFSVILWQRGRRTIRVSTRLTQGILSADCVKCTILVAKTGNS
jgi:hypothetical protein